MLRYHHTLYGIGLILYLVGDRMRLAKFKKIINQNLKKYVEKMGLQLWEVHVKILAVDKEENLKGCNYADWEYKTASIALYAHPHSSKEDVLKTLQHELAHCMHSGFSYLLADIEEMLIEKEIKYDKRHWDKQWGLMCEDTAVMVTNINLFPKKA